MVCAIQVWCQVDAKINPHLLNNRWAAKWITCPNISLKDYTVLHFRKTFQLDKKPEKFIIHVSGDNRYKLFVNGHEVCDGPARGDLAHWRYETIDIADKLISGKNILAAVVWNLGEFIPAAQITNKTAFILQGDGAVESIVNTDDHWKVYKNDAYQAPEKRALQTVVGQGELVYGPRYPYGWESLNYDDTDWKSPRILSHGFPYGKSEGWDWMLVPRNIPFMEHQFQRVNAIVRTENIQIDQKFLAGIAPVHISPHQKVTILFDQQKLTTAYPDLLISSGKNAVITMGYAEALTDHQGEKGNRNETFGRTLHSDFYDVFTADGGQNRHFETLWFRTFRYLELTVVTNDDPLIIQDIASYFTAYPFHENAYFKSDDNTLSKIWDTGWRTARLCAGETYYDCPYYEQYQYIADTRIQALISLSISGDDRLMRNAIEQFQQSILPMGLTQSRYPSSQPQIIPPFSLCWIAMVHDHWMYRDDPKFIKQQINGVLNVLDWYQQHISANGMLGPMDWWNFVDWSFGPYNLEKPIGGTPKGAIDGNSSILTLQYAYTLQLAADLLESTGDRNQAKLYRMLAGSLVQKTKVLCWNKQKGLIADSPEQDSYSQHANIMALLAGMFDIAEEKKIINKVLHEPKLTQATLYFKFYLAQAMNKAGLGDQYLDQLQPWKDMISLGLTTFAETPEPTRSDCHAWSAGPDYDLLATVCGISPGSPGFKTVKIAPHLGRLKFVKAKMPHPNGDILISLKKKNDSALEAEIILPQNLTGVFVWKGTKLALHSGKQFIRL
ncbi:alpha-L-rhamnosidase-related protein [Mucilaginibacter lappiensis]|uniref:alpha-L-rhamnosidase-related protein n=1 Tax=Mucilaginibacter lappiensis TaxID=354630 RepID=UPI001C849448|nr:alpha-L-rhamnosidase C-terminal domain-containing protein [Mucilaginibacter lappiensis]